MDPSVFPKTMFSSDQREHKRTEASTTPTTLRLSVLLWLTRPSCCSRVGNKIHSLKQNNICKENSRHPVEDVVLLIFAKSLSYGKDANMATT